MWYSGLRKFNSRPKYRPICLDFTNNCKMAEIVAILDDAVLDIRAYSRLLTEMLSTQPILRNAESNTNRHAFKTPSRGLAENRLGTLKGKGKAGVGQQTPFQTKTPFQKPLFTEADTQLKGGVRVPTRPFLDKTPFPNRIVNLSNANNIHAQTPYLHPASASGTPDSALRPSSTRKHIRVPRNSQKFETPLNTRNHWDVDSNDESADGIAVEFPELVLPEEEDFDEIEYMAPNTLDLPYQPPFDLEMPDYKVLGQTIMEASRNGAFYEPLESAVEFEIRAEDIEICDIALDFSSISDADPFFEFPHKELANPQPVKPKPTSIITCPMPLSTRTGIVTRTGASGISSLGLRSTTAAVTSKISHPGTSTSTATSNSRTTLTRPVLRTASRTAVSSRVGESTRPVNTATTIVRGSSTTSTTATSRSRARSNTTTNASSVVGAMSSLKRPASSAAASNKTTVRSTTQATLKRPTTSPARIADVVAQAPELGGDIVKLDRVEESLRDDFMFDV
ncbi:hypothetical protein F5876DRAFT_65252 [Lentinula aff. lateritia]|uniref:Uncharacterized protein n=1 Tax=Lentinula aff. lateritia TaxID=2804960 RepID=A0ACC1U1F0_9AGAR|nr:hypothetical protein F5876DRAFT_65252 [Lentinula aff. lateritia]